MTRLGLLGAAALALSSALAAPATAQQVIENPGYRNSYNRWEGERRIHRESGFWRGADVGFTGPAVVVAPAPFPADSYAWDGNADRGRYDQGYAQRNGFVCQPGTLFLGEDGLQHICQ